MCVCVCFFSQEAQLHTPGLSCAGSVCVSVGSSGNWRWWLYLCWSMFTASPTRRCSLSGMCYAFSSIDFLIFQKVSLFKISPLSERKKSYFQKFQSKTKSSWLQVWSVCGLFRSQTDPPTPIPTTSPPVPSRPGPWVMRCRLETTELLPPPTLIWSAIGQDITPDPLDFQSNLS